MKIISGKHKNRIIPTSKDAQYRPTTAKFREALFSIITSGEFFNSKSIADAQVLDLFAGTGILSFEALSRGVKSATLIDNNPEHLRLIEKFADKIGEKNSIYYQLEDASSLTLSNRQYNIVFMDPPYYNNLCAKALTCLIKNNWLENNAIIAMEMEKTAKLILEDFPNLHLLKQKVYGNSKLVIARYEQN
jgi:16S rRNA (guanine966-N2)-methyltransferase